MAYVRDPGDTPEQPVRRIGQFTTTLDGQLVEVGIDHDALTITFGGNTIRLDAMDRQALRSLASATQVAIDTYLHETGE